MGEILDTEIQEWSDEKLAAEYLNKSRKFVSQLHSKELYSENPSWQNTREPRLRGDDVEMRIIVSPIVESYMQLLEECFRRRLAEPIYSECLTMTENMLNGISNLPGCDNATSLAKSMIVKRSNTVAITFRVLRLHKFLHTIFFTFPGYGFITKTNLTR